MVSSKRVVSRRERRFRDLVLEAKSSSDEAPLNEAAALLTKEVLAGRLKLEAWDDSVEQWIIRVNRLAEWFPELEVNPLTDADRATLIEQICYGELGYRDIKDKPVMPVLKDWLTAEQFAVLDDYLPEKLTMANGRRSKLSYAKEGPPVLSARICAVPIAARSSVCSPATCAVVNAATWAVPMAAKASEVRPFKCVESKDLSCAVVSAATSRVSRATSWVVVSA